VTGSTETETETETATATGGLLVARSRIRRVLESKAGATPGTVAIHLDVDRFHQVNARFGQRVGDRVLEQLGPRLARVLPAGALVAPLQGDSFAVCVLGVVPGETDERIAAIAATLLEAVRTPFYVQGHTVHLSATVGWAAVTEGGSTSEPATNPATNPAMDLLERAFVACRHAKAQAPGSIRAFDASLGAETERRVRRDVELRRAIASEEFRIHVQPEVDLRDGSVVGVEVLIRWAHPERGLLPPGEFLPDAEASGLMSQIGEWVLERSIELAQRWADRGVRVWVNLAADQLVDGARVAERLRAAIDGGTIGNRSIALEVTESNLLEDLPAATRLLTQVRMLGVEVALDDFGTGYSSLSYLRKLPVTAVKIDRSFVSGIGGSLADEAIIEAVIDLAHALGLRVIAEGIEAVEQADTLARMGADHGQGYLFARPMSPDELEPLLDRAWCGVSPPSVATPQGFDRRADQLPGFGSPRARLLMAALDSARDSVLVTAVPPPSAAVPRAASTPSPLPEIVYVNAAFEAETGYRARDVIGRTVEMLLPDGQDRADDIAWFDEMHAARTSGSWEVASRRADGSTYVCDVAMSPIIDERGILTHWLHVRRDMSQVRRDEVERRRFEELAEQSTSMILMMEASGRCVYANQALRIVAGIPLDLPSADIQWGDIFSPSTDERLRTEVLPALRAHGRWTGEHGIAHAGTGEITEVVSEVQVVDDPLRPGVRIITAVSRDVTEANRSQRRERRRQELDGFSTLLADAVLERGPELELVELGDLFAGFGELLDVDQVYIDRVDTEAGTLRPIFDWRRDPGFPEAPPEQITLDALASWLARLGDGKLVIEGPEDIDTDWGRELSAVFPAFGSTRAVSAPLRANGVLLGVFGMARRPDRIRFDIDELALLQRVADSMANLLARQEAAASIERSRRRTQAMLAYVHDVIVVLDDTGTVLSVNDRIGPVLGRRAAEVTGRHFLDLLHPDDHPRAIDAFLAALRMEPIPDVFLRAERGDGSTVWIHVLSSGVVDPDLGGFLVSIRDVTEEVRASERAARRERFDQVALAISEWAARVDHDDIVAEISPQLRMLGETLGTDNAFASMVDGDRLVNVGGWSARERSADYQIPDGGIAVPNVIDRYLTLQPLVVDDITAVDPVAEPWVVEWNRFPHPDRAGLTVPLVARGRFLGVVGAAMLDEPRAWADDEVVLVQRVAETLASVLDRQRTDESLRSSEARLEALLEATDDLVLVLSRDGIVEYANGAVERALGRSLGAVVEAPLLGLVHPLERSDVLVRLTALEGSASDRTELVRMIGSDRTTSWWEFSSGGASAQLAGGRVFTARNVTLRHQRETLAASWVRLLQEAFDIAQTALDERSDEFVSGLDGVCRRIGELLGVDQVYVDRFDEERGCLASQGAWVAPDAECLLGTFEPVPFDSVPQWVERLRSTEPVVIADTVGRNKPWIAEKARVLGAERALVAIPMISAGTVLGVLGVSMKTEVREWLDHEVSFLRVVGETIANALERARVDAALRTSEARFRLLSETAADVVVMMRPDGILDYVSPSSAQVFGAPTESMIGADSRDLIHPDDLEHAIEMALRLRAGSPLAFEMRLRRGDGSYVWVSNSSSPVIDPETGRLVEIRASLRDITDRKQLEAELQRQALHDPLTGLANRTLLQSRLEVAVARRGDDNEVAVLLIDLDGFKTVNDTWGHAAGDDVLRLVAGRLRSQCRPSDTLARTGGDEFVLLCPETDHEAARGIAERIVQVMSTPINSNGRVVQLGASVGVAHHRGVVADADWLLIEADSAMYAAKRAGRGCVVSSADRRR
jgi:diguanylate cyclase (GGDEF)-like protein/PAS domain S-box-containing protein